MLSEAQKRTQPDKIAPLKSREKESLSDSVIDKMMGVSERNISSIQAWITL